MIVTFEELKKYRRRVAMVDGAFDPLHHGHVEYFKAAAEIHRPILCNVASDRYVSEKHPPFLSEEQRAAIIDSIRYIDYTHISRFDTETVLAELRPTHYVKGKDWEGRLPRMQIEICREHGIEIVYLDTVYDSSSRILQAYWPRHATDPRIGEFEAYVLGQQEVSSETYDRDYFASDWRDGGNRYTIEARRRIEGRHPRLIKEVFRPKRVLDMGCGPGILMYLLQEVGLVADGLDVSGDVLKVAPPEVRGRIHVGDITDPDIPDNSYDLVICREVFEHLTVLQIRRAVHNICRVSSRFVYVTTRFHPNPSHLLDVTTQLAVDPTHITLLNKDFLRLLFVLEGFKRRGDLEQRIDWQNKGRVLVYEKEGR